MEHSDQNHVAEERCRDPFAHYGLRENPFGVTPNPKYVYQSRTHRQAISSIAGGIEFSVGFQALIAPPGMGKTTVLLQVLEQFREIAKTAFLMQLQGNSQDLLRSLLADLGDDRPVTDLNGAKDAINGLAYQQFRLGRSLIVVIDEAQLLNVEVLETLRLLSNFETAKKKLLHIILSGQPQLAQNLRIPELAQLRQRIAIFTSISPFDRQETENYIQHRLRLAGHNSGKLFSARAVTILWKESEGIPRNVNMLCLNALLLAASRQITQIDDSIVEEVVRSRDLGCIEASVTLNTFAEHGSECKETLNFEAAVIEPPAIVARSSDSPAPTSSSPLHENRAPALETQAAAEPSVRESHSAAASFSDYVAVLRAQVTGRKLSLETILQNIAETAKVVTSADGATIAIRHDHSFICRARVGNPTPDLGSRLEIGSGLSGECLRTAETLCCSDALLDSRVDRNLCRQFGIRSLAIAPVGTKADITGVLEVVSRAPKNFRQEDVERLKQLSELVVTAKAQLSTAPSHIPAEKPVQIRSGWWPSKFALVAPLMLVVAGLLLLISRPLGSELNPEPSIVLPPSVPPGPAMDRFSTERATQTGSAALSGRRKISLASGLVITRDPHAETDEIPPNNQLVITRNALNSGAQPEDVAADATPSPTTLSTSAASEHHDLPIVASRALQGLSGGVLERQVNPVYPPEALAKGLQGTVLLHGLVTESGLLRNVKVISGDPLLTEAAMKAVAGWHYQPYELNGKPVATPTDIKFVFKLPE